MTVETIYHAVVKIHEGDVPRRIAYTAPNLGTAISTMATLCGRRSTADLYEFEILEVLGRDTYKRVATKLPTKDKPHISSKVLDREVENEGEASYIPYKLEVA